MATENTTRWIITATCNDGGQECIADRAYALGEYADQTFATREEAEAIAEELRADVGDVVDASVKYFVREDD